MTIPVTAALTGFCGLLLVLLAARISRLRLRNKVAWGDGGNPELMRAIRLHANTAEHAPIFVLMALAYELTRGSTPLLAATAGAFALARLAFAAALIGRGLHLVRMGAAMLTYLTQTVLAVLLLAGAFA